MTTTHTPGPWIAVDDGDSWNIQAEIAEGPDHGLFSVAEVSGKAFLTICGGTPGANARLIAAAPDLLAACEQAAQYMPCGEPSKGNGCIEPEGWGDVISQLNEAIAAATGKDGVA